MFVFAVIVVLSTWSPTSSIRRSIQGSLWPTYRVISRSGSCARGRRGRGREGRRAAGAAVGVIVPAVMVAFIFVLCFIWPIIGPVPSPTGGNILDSSLPAFSSGHFLGTDPVGNDEWSRLFYGGRASLEIALAVQAIGIVLGGLLGAIAAYMGGWRDATIMRVLDVVIAFPALVLAVAIAQGLGRASCTRSGRCASSAFPRSRGSRARPRCAFASRHS